MDKPNFSSTTRQSGVATLLVLLLVGMAIFAAVIGAFRILEGRQEQTVAVHAQTPAQITAWAGVEALKEYFVALRSEDALTFEELLDVFKDMMNDDAAIIDEDNIIARLSQMEPDPRVDDDADEYMAFFDITGEAGSGKSHAVSTLQVVFGFRRIAGEAEEGDCAPFCSDAPPAVITFNRNLRLSGSISVTTPPGESYTINVNGVLETGGNSITGVDIINATDSIHIGSGSSFNTLNSNGDIKLTGSVSGDGHLNARGNICLEGGSSALGSVKANGFVYGDGSVAFGDIEAIGVSDYTGTHSLCDDRILSNPGGKPFAVNMAGNNTVRSVKSKGSVRFNSGSVTTNPGVWAEGDLRDTNWGGSQSGTIGGVIQPAGNNNPAVAANINIVPGFTVSITPVGELNIPVTVFNAYDYETAANYAFKVDEDGFKVVQVRNVSGIPNGQYYIGSYDGPYKDRLCTALTAGSTPGTPVCSQPSDPTLSYPICWGQSDYNTCFTYTANNKTWSVSGKSMAQGVAWFEGKLNVSNGNYYNTFIATESIETSGSHKNVAPNFAGSAGGTYNYSIVHSQWWTENKSESFKGICSNGVSPHYPQQICNGFSAGEPVPIANYAYMSGSIVGDNYVGGNVKLGASTVSFGSVLAGNEFDSGGDTTVFGYISALGGGTSTFNAMGGSTKIIVDQLPPTYIPMNGITIGEGGGGGAPPGPDGWDLINNSALWARYR